MAAGVLGMLMPGGALSRRMLLVLAAFAALPETEFLRCSSEATGAAATGVLGWDFWGFSKSTV